MARTHTFKGSASAGYGYFAYIEDGQLVIGEEWGRDGGILFRGTYEEAVKQGWLSKLWRERQKLFSSIEEYYNGDKVDVKDSATTPCPAKLCELKVDRKDSLQELIYHLTANGYTVQTAVVWKEYPNSGIDHWMISVFDKE